MRRSRNKYDVTNDDIRTRWILGALIVIVICVAVLLANPEVRAIIDSVLTARQNLMVR